MERLIYVIWEMMTEPKFRYSMYERSNSVNLHYIHIPSDSASSQDRDLHERV